MKEKVGICTNCHKTIYCMDGFLDGVVTEDKHLYCFLCINDQERDEEKG